MSGIPNELELAGNGTVGSFPDALPSWKRELNDKIAAARARRQAGRQNQAAHESPGPEDDTARSRASRVAAAVAARYAHAPSYSEYLASEVRAAMMAAVAAQAAANHARAAADAILNELHGNETRGNELRSSEIQEAEARALPPSEARLLPAPPPQMPAARASSRPAPAPRVDHAASGFQPSMPAPAAQAPPRQEYQPAPPVLSDPVQAAFVTPATPLPAKLLEFPRELIAARKARPRHAEGPLREGTGEEPGQLRIFEVEPSAISTKPEPPPQATEWSSIRLDAYPDEAHAGSRLGAYSAAYQAQTPVTSSHRADGNHPAYNREMANAYSYASRIQTVEQTSNLRVASIADRLMAGLVDAALVGIAFSLFVLVFAASTSHPPTGKPALFGGAVVLMVLYLLYQLLFFTYADGTPGMRYARIALCTFEDENPTRELMRKRIFALVLAAAPLGLGFLYAVFDEDHLGWHDRMTRMYQRSY